jgi:hypothetical protein
MLENSSRSPFCVPASFSCESRESSESLSELGLLSQEPLSRSHPGTYLDYCFQNKLAVLCAVSKDVLEFFAFAFILTRKTVVTADITIPSAFATADLTVAFSDYVCIRHHRMLE